MDKTPIPYATGESVVRDFPDSTLHVTTRLAEHFGEPGFNAEAKSALERAVLQRRLKLGLERHQIHWAQP